MPLISVVIPVYNGEKTIKETVESVLNQTFSDFELIVINDGSQDSTLDILSKISDPRLKVFSYSNAGLAASRNRGIALASGEYISFIDADDLWTADKLEAQLKALQTNPQASVAYSWTDWIDESNQFLRSGGHILANGQVYTKLLIRDFVESGSNPLIRKQAFDAVGNFDESLTAVEDWDMWLRLSARYDFVAVPSPQILYRISANSMSTNVWKMEKSSLQVIERAFAEANQSSELDSSIVLRRKVLGSRYQYLTLKALEGNLERRKGLASARFFWLAIINDPTWLKRPKLMLIILVKVMAATLLPQNLTKNMLKTVKALRQGRQAFSLDNPNQFKTMARSLEGRLFIVGCPRSGTTLLQSFLAAHPDIISFPESHFFDNLIPHHEPRRYALGLASNRVDDKLKQFFQAIHQQDLEQKLTRFIRFQFQYVRLFIHTLDTLAHKQNKRFWLEKTPEHLGYIDYIEKYVPKVKFIHIVRDGKDVVASLHEVTQKYPKVWGKSWTLDCCIERWIESIQISCKHQHKSNHRIVRYENLTDNPHTVLKLLCEFINIDFDEKNVAGAWLCCKIVNSRSRGLEKSVTQDVRNSNSKKFYQVLNLSEQDYVLNRLSEVNLDCLQLNSTDHFD